MKISKEYPQFTDAVALFIVTGKLVSKYYIAKDGAIENVGEFQVHKANYPDREGYSRVMGHGKTYSYEALDIGKDTWRLKEFKEGILRDIKNLINSYQPSEIYIFSEKELLKTIRLLFPKNLHALIRGEYPKNLVNEHPFNLLKSIVISKENLGKSVPANKKAGEILKRKTKD